MGVSEEQTDFLVMTSRIVTCRKTQAQWFRRSGGAWAIQGMADRYRPVLFVSQNTRLVENNMKLGYTEIWRIILKACSG